MKTWLEVALNGPWGRERQPGVPTTVEACIEQGIACVEAGAAIVHIHAFDAEADEQNDDPEFYAQVIEGIQDEVDAIVYPTIPLAGSPGQPAMTGEERFAHQDVLGQRGLLEWAVVDPGSTNFSTYDDIARDEPGFVYENPEDHVRTGLDVATKYGASPSYAIYEPGFVRLGAALTERFSGMNPPIYRFMFSENYTFGFPPEPYALDSYLTLLANEAPDAPWMVSGLGVDITPLIPEAVDRGGHVRIGLEDAPLGSNRNNVEWTEHARREIENAGGTLATATEIRTVQRKN